MKIPVSVKPAVWGMICGGIATMVVGFSWGGWITTGTAGQMEKASAKAAVVLAFTPLCVAMGEPQLEKLTALKELSSWKHNDFVAEAGWVDNVSEEYRDDVAGVCASTLIEGMKLG
jgi:dienelactone hydrolase